MSKDEQFNLPDGVNLQGCVIDYETIDPPTRIGRMNPIRERFHPFGHVLFGNRPRDDPCNWESMLP